MLVAEPNGQCIASDSTPPPCCRILPARSSTMPQNSTRLVGHQQALLAGQGAKANAVSHPLDRVQLQRWKGGVGWGGGALGMRGLRPRPQAIPSDVLKLVQASARSSSKANAAVWACPACRACPAPIPESHLGGVGRHAQSEHAAEHYRGAQLLLLMLLLLLLLGSHYLQKEVNEELVGSSSTLQHAHIHPRRKLAAPFACSSRVPLPTPPTAQN